MTKKLPLLALALALIPPAMAADVPSEVTLIKNVNVFDGENEQLLEGYDVLVVRNLVKQVGRDIPTSGTHELDVKTGGLKIPSRTSRCWPIRRRTSS